MQQEQQLDKDDNKKEVVVQMGGRTLVLAIGSSILSSLLLLLLFPPRHKKQQQQHNDDDNKLWRRLPHPPHPFLVRQFQTNNNKNIAAVVVDQQQPQQQQEYCCAQKIQHNIVVVASRIASALVGSFLSSSLAPNLLSQLFLLPRRRRRIQNKHNDNGRQVVKIVVVDQEPRQPARTCLLEIAEGEDTLYTINYGPRGIIPLATCHGMFLSKTHQNPVRLAIWDPTTSNKKKKKLVTTIPQSSVPRPPRVEFETVRTFGFGFNPQSSNDYKVIKFLRFDFEDGRHSLLVELYSLKTNSWKQVAYPHGDVKYGCDLVCLNTNNGFCYARARSGAHRLVFIPFDLANDSFPPALIPWPPHTSRRSSFAPVVFEGSQLAVIAYQHKPFEFELWVWNNDESCWSLRGEWANIGDPDIGYTPRGQFVNNGVVFLQNDSVDHELLLFDCAKQTLRVIGVYDDPFVYVFPYNVHSEIKDR